MKLFKIVSLPVLIILYIFHYTVLSIRNKLYDYRILKTYHFNNTKIISVGNLKVGGAGKTPLVEYLINILPNHRIAILSRGYKRKTHNFLFAEKNHSAFELGDEMHQVYKKNINLTIAVDTNRIRGVRKILEKNNKKIIILDDGYQHRSLKRDLNILVTEYNKLYSDDFLFPLGKLREYKRAAKRANLIVVTKCPKNISERKKETIKKKLLSENQKIFFSYIKKYTFISNNEILKINIKEDFFIATGIENPNPLIEEMIKMKINFDHFKYNDHYIFKTSDINYLIKMGKLKNIKNLIVTEKDFYRLSEDNIKLIQSYFKLIYVQIEFDFIKDEKAMFNKQILKFI